MCTDNMPSGSALKMGDVITARNGTTVEVANTDAEGTFRFVTLRPGPVPGRGNTLQAPHIAIRILARGLMAGLVTRAYFAGDALNDSDPLLTSIDDPALRRTLIAGHEGAAVWRLDIRLQGDGETLFLDV